MLVLRAVVRTVTNAVVTIMAPAPVRTQSLVIIFTLTLLCCGRVKYGGYSHMAGSPPPLPFSKLGVLCVHYFGSEDSIGRRLVSVQTPLLS